jgi:peptide/nickel transport system substrate-binding protein
MDDNLPTPKKAVLVLLLLLLTFLVACGGAAATPEATTAPPADTAEPAAANSATPTAVPQPANEMDVPAPNIESGAQRGGILRTARPSDVRFLDAHLTDDPNHSLWALYSGFVNYDWSQPEVTIVPDLATWESSDDGLSWTFHLDPNAVFHNGEPVTSNDVVLSLQRHFMHPNRESAVAPFLEDQVTDIAAPDDHTVELTIKTIRPDMIPLFANNNMSFFPASIIEQLGGPEGPDEIEDESLLIGSGPFKFKNHDLGVVFEVERNEDYYNPDQVYLDGLQHYTFTDEATRNAAFIAGQVDLYWGTGNDPAQQVEAKKSRPDCNEGMAPNCAFYGATSGTRAFWAMLNPEIEKFQDFRVRKAIFLSLDRWDVIEKVELGAGEPIVSAPPDFGGFTLAEMEQMPGLRRDKTEDWAESKRLLEEAGQLGTKLTIMGTTSAATRAAQLIYAESLKQGGFEVEIDQPPDAATRQQRESDCDFELTFSRIGPDFADPGAYLVMYEGGQPQNRCDIPFPKLWELHRQQASSLDSAERAQVVEQMNDIILNDEEEGLWAYFTHTLGHPYSYDPKVHWDPPKVLRGWGRYLNIWIEQ